jgi:hypothetical protein
MAGAQSRYAIERKPAEWFFMSSTAYVDHSLNEVTLDMIVTGRSGSEQSVSAFLAGDQPGRVPYAPAASGLYHYRTVCSDNSNSDLHSRTGPLTAEPYGGEFTLYRLGGIRVSPDKRHFAHSDGTPFFRPIHPRTGCGGWNRRRILNYSINEARIARRLDRGRTQAAFEATQLINPPASRECLTFRSGGLRNA